MCCGWSILNTFEISLDLGCSTIGTSGRNGGNGYLGRNLASPGRRLILRVNALRGAFIRRRNVHAPNYIDFATFQGRSLPSHG